MKKALKKIAKAIMYVVAPALVGAVLLGNDMVPLPDPVTRAYVGAVMGALVGLYCLIFGRGVLVASRP